jgi:hypothetical protein
MTDHPGLEAKKSGANLAAFGIHGLGPNGILGDASTAGGIGVKGYGQPGVLGFGFSNSDGVDGQVSNACCSAVYGQNSGAGNGVAGRADSGTGVLAASDNGIALKVDGKAQFSRSGVVTIAYPAKTAVVSGVAVTAKTLAFATIQKFLAGTYVVAAVPNTSGSSDSFTIYLNKAPGSSTTPKSVVVAWNLVERS